MVKGITYFILATVGLLFGSVQPWIMSVYAALMVLAFVVLMWQGGLSWRSGVWVWATVGFFLGVTLLQMVPLSQGMLALLSPVRAGILEKAAGLLGAGDSGLSSGYTLAYSVKQAFARWGYILCLVLFFWVCVSLGRERKAYKALVWVALAYGVFAAVYGLIQVLIPTVGVWWVPGDASSGEGCARGTYINRNHFAGLMEMLWPVALGVTLAHGEWEEGRGIKAALSGDRINTQLVRFLVVTLMVVALLFSRSRAGIVGAFVGMSVLIWLIRAVSGRFRWGFRITLGALVALVAVYGASVGFDKIVERFLATEQGAAGRMETWGPTWQMVLDHPFGIGLGNYEIVEPVYVDRGAKRRSYHAHNDYLQFLVEAGWIGVVPLVAGFFLFLIRGIRRVRRIGFDVGRFRLMVSIGALAGLCAMAFHGFFDFNFQIPANQVYFVLLLALVETGLWPEGSTGSGFACCRYCAGGE